MLQLTDDKREKIERLMANPSLPWKTFDDDGWDASGRIILSAVNGTEFPTITDLALYIQELQQQIFDLKEAVREAQDAGYPDENP